MGLTLQTEDPKPGTRLLRVAGEVDLDTVAQLDECAEDILRARPRVFVVEFSGVSYLGSAGIGALLTINSEMVSRGGRLIVAGARESVLATLKMVGFAEVGLLMDSLEDALRFSPVAPGQTSPS